MGVLGGVPFVVAPGITYGIGFQMLATTSSIPTALAADIIVGVVVLCFALVSRRAKMITSLPEDYRLGVAAGIGALLALIGVRSMNIVPFGSTSYVTTFSYKTVLGVCGVILIAVIQAMSSKELASSAFAISIIVITIASVIVRAAQNNQILPPNSATLPSISPLLMTQPDFTLFGYNDGNNFAIFSYIILTSLNKLFDLVATIAALILLAVMSRLGYSKDTFVSVLSESEKCVRIYLVDAICNMIVAPLLGCAVVTPFIESAAGIVVGGRSGLTSVVTGSLFLISALFANAIATIIPSEASGGAILVACFSIIQGLQHVDYTRTTRSIPALMAFVLIPFTSSIGVGVSFSYITLFVIWCLTPNWVKLRGQMVVMFTACVLLLCIETRLINTVPVLGGVLGGCVIFSAIFGALMVAYREKFEKWYGQSQFDVGSSSNKGGLHTHSGNGGDGNDPRGCLSRWMPWGPRIGTRVSTQNSNSEVPKSPTAEKPRPLSVVTARPAKSTTFESQEVSPSSTREP